MLNHQIEFSKAMCEIYKPISGRMSDPDSLVLAGNIDGIHACEEYEAVVKDLREALQPELEMIDQRIVAPANELLDVIKAIRKTALKRDHKQLDYDRHRATLKKLQDKKEKSAKDEKAMWKAENEVENATQEFNYYNDLLKEELPQLFRLEKEFIQPLFQSFYYMQLNIFYTMHEKMQQTDIGYFDLTLELEEGFNQKRGDIQDQVEKLAVVKFKTSGRPRPPKMGTKPALEAGKKPLAITAGSSSSAPNSSVPQITYDEDAQEQAPPAYSMATKLTFTSTAPTSPMSPPYKSPTSPGLAAAAAAKKKPPPPKPKPQKLSAAPAAEIVTALYDYSAQAEGDLSFRAGDRITIVTRTQNENEWWTGKLNGKQGQFPGKHLCFLAC
jgi:amphiphysin